VGLAERCDRIIELIDQMLADSAPVPRPVPVPVRVRARPAAHR
jgi:hypothetical protein